MKKLLFTSFLSVFVLLISYAQIIEKPIAPVKQKGIIKTIPVQPAPPPPPASNNKSTTTSTQNTLVYTLTAARVNIRTGTDNKEYPSGVIVWLFSLGGGYTLEQPGENLKNEFRINSNTEFGLQNNSKNDPKYRTLEAFQKEGMGLRIRYSPNLFTDAWKIESLSITLEFRDQNGNLHPQYGNKTIAFSMATGFLNYWDTDLFCKSDVYFNPLTAVISHP
jgi:hypothetical protein